MELFFLWVIVAIICALIAGHKNRSRVGWFALGFFFSLAALCVLACLRPRHQPVHVTAH